MRYRHEVKYLLKEDQYVILKNRLKTILKPDQHVNDNNEYTVSSIYFDDLHYSALETKKSGVLQRKKYRIRSYNHSLEHLKFEKKLKNESYVSKIDLKLNNAQYREIMQGSISFLNDMGDLGKEIVHEYKYKLLRPKVLIEYEREAYIHSVGNIRVTFDKNLRYSFTDFTQSTQRVYRNNEIILEIKYDYIFPSYIKSLFDSEDLIQLSISKYALAYESRKGEQISE